MSIDFDNRKYYRDEYILDDDKNVDRKKLNTALTNHKFNVLVVELNKIFKEEFFSICSVTKVYRNLHDDYNHESQEYEYLDNLHCVHWKLISKDTKEGLIKVILDYLECPRIGFDEKTYKFYDKDYVDLSRKKSDSEEPNESLPDAPLKWWQKVFK